MRVLRPGEITMTRRTPGRHPRGRPPGRAPAAPPWTGRPPPRGTRPSISATESPVARRAENASGRELLRSPTETARRLCGAAACSLARLSDDESELMYTTASSEGANDVTGMSMILPRRRRRPARPPATGKTAPHRCPRTAGTRPRATGNSHSIRAMIAAGYRPTGGGPPLRSR